MKRRRSFALAAGLTLLAAVAPAAVQAAAPPDRWTALGRQDVPIDYYQGLTHVGADLFFVGVFEGGYLTAPDLRERVRNTMLITPALTAAAGFNHIGDPTYDPSAGGRLIAPMECYHPELAQPNTCGYGGFGVVDPATLTMRYWVRLDGADVPKAMWAETAPDGRLLWTSSGTDLVAYRTADVSPAHAATGPASAPITPAKRLLGLVPPSGVSGAAFSGGKLLLAGGDTGSPQIWAVDLASGRRVRVLHLPASIKAEVEGIDIGADGILRWLLTPSTLRDPTYGAGHSELLSFAPSTARVTATAAIRGRTLTVHARLRNGTTSHALGAAAVRAGATTARTDKRGVARLTLPATPRRPVTVTVGEGKLPALTMRVRP